ncbi:MAG: alpha/beta hydrolase [Anaerolineales bacterium]|nr:alpha/beta hydrolase [Anaerolineales bacterium]
MNDKPFALLILISLFLSACAPQSSPAAPRPSIPLETCALVSPRGAQTDARCGTLTVPEDRANPGGRQIALNIAVIPAIKRNPAPDPLFLLAGGPGQSAIESFPSMLPLLYDIHESRDIVLVDQRGTGKSNPLRCLDLEDQTLTDEQALEQLKTCPQRLDADPRFYTTEIAMTDLDEVRAALGYDKINLYGASYGTRAALTYLRMFPQRVRTVTLDAVVEADFVMFLDAAADGQAALQAFFARCQSDPDCSEAFPNLEKEFAEVLARLEQSPADITIPHPLTNRPLNLTVTPRLVTNMVFNTLYVPDLTATLPVAIHAAYTDANYIPLISSAFMVADAGLYDGMFYAVTCTEDAPLIDPAESARRSAGSVFSDRTIDFAAVCAEWPKGQVSPSFRALVRSDVPVLILSGEADPITPPYHAERAAEGLSNHLHIIFPGMGHGNLSSRCVANILRDFLQAGSLDGLNTACVAGIQPPPFFVDFSGPQP